MKLINKITIWYLVITTVVLIAGGILVLYSVQDQIIQEESRKLIDAIEFTAKQIEEGKPLPKVEGYQIELHELDFDAAEMPMRVVDTMAWFEPHGHLERELRASASYKINGRHYVLTTYNFIGEEDDIGRGIWQSLSWIGLLLLVFVGISGRLISKWVLAPFNQSLLAMQTFDLTRENALQLSVTSTKEFKDLNYFLSRMTSKAQGDYQALEEFSENASHELQTPLSIIRGKLELLMESDINDAQAQLIMAAQQAAGNLSRVHESLILLTKLENQEFEAREPVNFSQRLGKTIAAFDELMEMKHIFLEKEIEENVHVRLHALLLEVLLNNLVSNAIRHNHPFGKIRIELTAKQFVIKNTGNPPDVPIAELFHRFRKGSLNTDSVGLGLPIIKQICDLNQFQLDYQWANFWHTITIGFSADRSDKK